MNIVEENIKNLSDNQSLEAQHVKKILHKIGFPSKEEHKIIDLIISLEEHRVNAYPSNRDSGVFLETLM